VKGSLTEESEEYLTWKMKLQNLMLYVLVVVRGLLVILLRVEHGDRIARSIVIIMLERLLVEHAVKS